MEDVVGISAVDMFCGAGGLTHGLIASGIKVVAGFDIDPRCRYPYEVNNNAMYIKRDVREVHGKDIAALYPDGATRVLAGCAPCQPFSPLSNRNKLRRVDDKWSLLDEFSRLVRELKPQIVTMENVPQLCNELPFHRFIQVLDSLDYHRWHGIIHSEEYGVPQRRRRLVLLASQLGGIGMIPPTHRAGSYRTVRDAIGHLEALSTGGASEADPLHRCQGMTKKNLRRIRLTSEGGGWRDWPEYLRCDCHRTSSGSSYTPVYGRMVWDSPAPTITTQFHNYGSGRFGHPEQDRGLSLREGALLQSFPSRYAFVDPCDYSTLSSVACMIGNAVPVRLGKAIGTSIKRHIRGTRYAE